MAYSISTAMAIYFVIWWITLFLTLPFGIRSQHEDGEGVAGTDPGARVMGRMGRKMAPAGLGPRDLRGRFCEPEACPKRPLFQRRAAVAADGNAAAIGLVKA